MEALTYQFPACEWRDETGLANIFAEDGRPVSAPGPSRWGLSIWGGMRATARRAPVDRSSYKRFTEGVVPRLSVAGFLGESKWGSKALFEQ